MNRGLLVLWAKFVRRATILVLPFVVVLALLYVVLHTGPQ